MGAAAVSLVLPSVLKPESVPLLSPEGGVGGVPDCVPVVSPDGGVGGVPVCVPLLSPEGGVGGVPDCVPLLSPEGGVGGVPDCVSVVSPDGIDGGVPVCVLSACSLILADASGMPEGAEVEFILLSVNHTAMHINIAITDTIMFL